MTADPDALVTVTTTPTEFEAEVLVAVLKSEGIEARAFSCIRVALPFGCGKSFEVPVKVLAADLERARAVLKQNKQDSVDIDWDEVEVGTPENGGIAESAGSPDYEPNKMPGLAKISFAVILGLLALMLLSALASWLL